MVFFIGLSIDIKWSMTASAAIKAILFDGCLDYSMIIGLIILIIWSLFVIFWIQVMKYLMIIRDYLWLLFAA